MKLRIIAPSRALLKSGMVHTYETMRLMTPPEVARAAPDSIVFQRQLEPGQIEVMEWVKNTSKALRVFELDDLITNLPPKSAHRASKIGSANWCASFATSRNIFIRSARPRS